MKKSKAKTYILYITWGGTVNNHAGMAYLLSVIKKKFPNEVKLIKVPATIGKWPYYLKRLHFHFIIFILRYLLKPNDKVLFMEYLVAGAGDQSGIAIKLRNKKVTSMFYGMVHLPERYLLNLYGSLEYIQKSAEVVDKIVVLGSSLTSFFDSLGYGEKVIQTFHYVDNRFYKPMNGPKSEKMQVLHMGCLGRNFERLKKIVESCPEIDFHVCTGGLDLNSLFKYVPNVNLHEFLPENELLMLMQKCHVSLSVLDDTVGSNVITTSLACGLVNVVSDIGSIRDYCNNENSVLCKNNNEFVTALNKLNSNKSLLQRLSIESLKCSSNLSMERSIDFFYNKILR